MPQKLATLIQNGVITIVPDSNYWHKFVNDYNRQVTGSRNAEREYITLTPMSADESAKYAAKQKTTSPVPKVDKPDLKAENQALRDEISELKSMFLRHMSDNKTKVVQTDEQEEVEETKKQRGRPPKNT